MQKREALRLQTGDRIGYGHSMWTVEIDKKNSYRRGAVVRVTPKGGILVKDDGYAMEMWCLTIT